MDLTETATAAAEADAARRAAEKEERRAVMHLNDRTRLITLVREHLGLEVDESDLVEENSGGLEYGRWAVIVDGHMLALVTGHADGFYKTSGPNQGRYALVPAIVDDGVIRHGSTGSEFEVNSMAKLGELLTKKVGFGSPNYRPGSTVYYLDKTVSDYAGTVLTRTPPA